MKKIIPILFLMILMAMLVYSIVTVEHTHPDDDFYLIRGGGAMGNLTFIANATPVGASGAIQNVSLYHNISGTWGLNSTELTVGASGTEVERQFMSVTNTSIYSGDLSDGLVFDWNIYACDNITKFYFEDVSLDSDVFTTYDNRTNTTGHGLCIANSSNCVVVTAGRGQVVHYPISTLDGVVNTTRLNESLVSYCTLNGSSEGYFRCNQTRTTYNGSGDVVSTEALITSSVKVNYTISSSCRWGSVNRTVYVEDAPSITFNYPANNAYLNDSTVTINYTITGDSSTYLCDIYTNDTGNWTQESGSSTATNNTLKTTSTVISEKNGVTLNIRCAETANSNIFGWVTSNYTITIDETAPAITSSAVSYSNSSDSLEGYSAFINLSVVDNNENSCHLYLNGTLNITSSYTSSTAFAQYFNASDGAYTWFVVCDDTTASTTTTSNSTIVIDTIFPSLSSTINGSNISNCRAWELNFTMSEVANFTLEYGLTAGSKTYSDVESDYETTQSLTLGFNESYETVFYANLTFCDRAGNCNNSESSTFQSPIPLCTGWSLWSVYDLIINLSDYRARSGADYVYYWNNSGQTWIYSSAASSSHANHNMTVGDAVLLYENTNATYFRNISKPVRSPVNETLTMDSGNVTANVQHVEDIIALDALRNATSENLLGYCNFTTSTGGLVCNNTHSGTIYADYRYKSYQYYLNITGGHVYFGLYHDYSFGNISHVILRNTSDGNYTPEGLVTDIKYLSSFNNSAKEYVDSIYTWSWNNATTLGKNYKNSLDALWVYIDYNISINFTTNGNIYANWT